MDLKQRNEVPKSKAAVVNHVLALVALGLAIALAVVQVSKILKHEVLVKVLLPTELLEDLRKIEMVAIRKDQAHPSASVEIRFDEKHPASLPVEHKFELRNGVYEIHFRVFGLDNTPGVRGIRTLEVAGSVSVQYQLP